MALPTKALTWQYSNNNLTAPQGTILATNKKYFFDLKTALKAFGTNPPSVTSSSNGTGTAGAGDNITTTANVVWGNAGSNHTWIVLRYTAIGSTFEILLSLEAASGTGATFTMLMSWVGFTGGTATARPTAADEVSMLNSASFFLAVEPVVGYKFHIQQSTDGKQVRVVTYSSAVLVHVLMWGAVSVPSGITWSTNAFVYARNGTNTLDYNIICITTVALVKARGNGGTMDLWLTGESWNTTLILGTARNQQNDFATGGAAQDLMPIGLASETVGSIGRVGQIVDLWWGVSTNGNCDTFPNDATRTFVQHGDIVFPNDGTLIAST